MDVKTKKEEPLFERMRRLVEEVADAKNRRCLPAALCVTPIEFLALYEVNSGFLVGPKHRKTVAEFLGLHVFIQDPADPRKLYTTKEDALRMVGEGEKKKPFKFETQYLGLWK